MVRRSKVHSDVVFAEMARFLLTHNTNVPVGDSPVQVREVLMFICLLLRFNAASPAPFFAIPVVIAGLALSVLMIVSGVTGLMAAPRRSTLPGRRTRALVSFSGSPRFLSLIPFRR